MVTTLRPSITLQEPENLTGSKPATPGDVPHSLDEAFSTFFDDRDAGGDEHGPDVSQPLAPAESTLVDELTSNEYRQRRARRVHLAKLVAAILGGCVALIALAIGAGLNRNRTPDTGPNTSLSAQAIDRSQLAVASVVKQSDPAAVSTGSEIAVAGDTRQAPQPVPTFSPQANPKLASSPEHSRVAGKSDEFEVTERPPSHAIPVSKGVTAEANEAPQKKRRRLHQDDSMASSAPKKAVAPSPAPAAPTRASAVAFPVD